MKFGVRVPLILERQEQDVRQAIQIEVDEVTAPYLSEGVYKLPMPSVVFSGRAA